MGLDICKQRIPRPQRRGRFRPLLRGLAGLLSCCVGSTVPALYVKLLLNSSDPASKTNSSSESPYQAVTMSEKRLRRLLGGYFVGGHAWGPMTNSQSQKVPLKMQVGRRRERKKHHQQQTTFKHQSINRQCQHLPPHQPHPTPSKHH